MKKGMAPQQPPKSNFFFIMMMTFLIVWTIKVMNSRPDEPVVATDEREESVAVAPKLSEQERASLPEEFVEAASLEDSEVGTKYVTIGSLDVDSPYKMLVTLTSRGAAVARVELNEETYADNSDQTGYLGQIVVDETRVREETEYGLPGVCAQVVGLGAPAERAGLHAGDRIVGFVSASGASVKIDSFDDLRNALLSTRAGDKVKLEVYEAERLSSSDEYRMAISAFENLQRISRSSEKTELSSSQVVAVDDDSREEPTVQEATDVAVNEDDEHATRGTSDANEESESGKVRTLQEIIASFGSPRILEVSLTAPPLSVLRPSGMTLDYDDYESLAGLQAIDYQNDDAYVLMNYDSKAPHQRKANSDPASFLMTLASIDSDSLTTWSPPPCDDKRVSSLNAERSALLDSELPGVALRDSDWRYDGNESSENVAVFKKVLLDRRLELTKKYELVQNGTSPKEGNSADSFVKNGRAYHLNLTLEIKNFDASSSRRIAYLLDGPTGLPLEGAWFSSGRKTGPGWGSYGLRDLVVSANEGKNFNVIKCWDLAQDKTRPSDSVKLDFLGVDGQYFQCTALPDNRADGVRFTYAPIRVGSRFTQHLNFTDVSFRVKSDEQALAPYGQQGDSFRQEFTVFIGPKQRDVMADYGLSKTIVYGWFWFVSIPLLWILHFFHDYLVFNYGVAIIMLTILVRLCLFPLSRKQVASSLRMQKLQPEINKLKEKYKDNPQEMMAAQQALFKKHGVNPLSGCLPIFIQMPIFIGLYKALSLDVNLYGAPLFSKSIRWCSNLAAPDMALNWSEFWKSIGWPSFNMSGGGFLSFFSLGPYLNVLPIITIALFLIQQKLLVPPVVGDDAQAQQQRTMRRMMNFMMIFMGFMFFKVPSGLCVYFIVSSLWGLLERKMLPRRDVELAADAAPSVAVQTSRAPSGFESKKDKTTQAKAGRKYEVFEARRDKKGRRVSSGSNEKPKSKLRLWWEEVLERAKEQQRLAKAEAEKRATRGKNNKRGK